MKDHLEYLIERNRNAQLEAVAMLIKRRIMGYLQRKRFLKAREDVITIQKNYKVLKWSVFLFLIYRGGWKASHAQLAPLPLVTPAFCAFLKVTIGP